MHSAKLKNAKKDTVIGAPEAAVKAIAPATWDLFRALCTWRSLSYCFSTLYLTSSMNGNKVIPACSAALSTVTDKARILRRLSSSLLPSHYWEARLCSM
jgi:hypothetical protein